MTTFFATLLRFFLHAFRSKRIILSENALLKKENEILLRRVGKKRVDFNIFDKKKIGDPVCMSPVLGGLHHRYYR